MKARADRDPAFRAGLYQEAVQAMLDGDFSTAKCLLRDVINATLGFAQLVSRADIPEKSLMRMFGPDGNPRAENLIAVVATLREECQGNRIWIFRLRNRVAARVAAGFQVWDSAPRLDT